MRRISIVTPKSLDALGRIIAVTRRAKVQLVDMTVTSEDFLYRVHMKIEGPHDEVQWLVSKLDKLPEVLKIDEGNIDINY
jgi:acetolactate synthase II small subunit